MTAPVGYKPPTKRHSDAEWRAADVIVRGLLLGYCPDDLADALAGRLPLLRPPK